MKFKFIGEHKNLYTDETESTTTVEFRGEGLEEVLRSFEDFLRGCGYVVNGTIDIIPEEEYNSSDDIEHSEHYYDFDRNQPFVVAGAMDDTISFTGNGTYTDGVTLDFGAAQPALNILDDIDLGSINITITPDDKENENRN